MHNNSHISDQIVLITSSAEQGDANSQHELGMLYVKGKELAKISVRPDSGLKKLRSRAMNMRNAILVLST
jgi:hypothetical protein